MDDYYVLEPKRPTPAEMIMLLNMFMMVQGFTLITLYWEQLVWKAIPVKSNGDYSNG